MKKVIVKNLQSNVYTHTGYFETQNQVDMWIGECASKNKWGLPERPELNELGEPTGATLPAEYTIEQVDISAEVSATQKLNQGLTSQNFGAQLIAKVWALNETKAEANNLTQEQFDAILADADLAMIERLLWNGSLKTAKAKIQALSTSYFTQAEKDAFISEINNFLGV